MGEPIVDLNPTRLDRQIQRARQQTIVRQMYGASDYTDELVRRIRSSARRSMEIQGHVVYDVEPIEFDDLIEVRSGGDRSMMVRLERDGTIPWVSFWPLSFMDDNAVLEGWEETLRSNVDSVHDVCVEVNSQIEQALSYDFGYVPYKADTGLLRRLTAPQFADELREALRAERELATGIRPRARILHYTNTGSNATVTFTPYNAADIPVIRPPRGPRLGDPMPPPWEPIPELVDEEAPDDEWVFDQEVTTWDGARVGVDVDGLDRNSNNPLLPGYRLGLCNCDDCRDQRVEADDEADDDIVPEEDDMDYDEEEA